ncbi:hypothetical protein ACC763_38270, partial [Rhizobium ruizarguesonis]
AESDHDGRGSTFFDDFCDHQPDVFQLIFKQDFCEIHRPAFVVAPQVDAIRVPSSRYEMRNVFAPHPAPVRDEKISVDETFEDIEFQRKYLSMESA